MINKSSVTTLLSLILIGAGHCSPLYQSEIRNMGLYATSGAVTNWIAIFMLFEKVPFLYGSGVIPLRFEEFKIGIKSMMMDQFFTEENISKFLSTSSSTQNLDLKKISQAVDYDLFFNKLVEAIEVSPMGQMLAMVGGVASLEPVRGTFADKMKEGLEESVEKPEFKAKLAEVFMAKEGQTASSGIQEQVASIVENRLNELTPTLVKDIIQNMIREHLGWLVVWGGIFGAIIGLIASISF
jgi:uncharacterized membrane protein YheB (UPF0754 family)